MKRVRAFDKTTGEFTGRLYAAAVTEDMRRAQDYKCDYAPCDCTMHWRKAVNANANTDPHPPTFVKNRSSRHRVGCYGDYERIVRENVDYVTLRDGQMHVKVNFPLGSSRVDRYPQRGWLTEQQLAAAKDARDIKPFSSLKVLTRFIEKEFKSLDSDGAADIIVNYQGASMEWGKLFKGSDQYQALYGRATDYKHDDGQQTQPIITIVNPDHEIEQNRRNKTRYICEPQDVTIDGRKQRIIPIIVCDGASPAVNKEIRAKIEAAAANDMTIAIASRPFNPGWSSVPTRYSKQYVSLLVHNPAQLEQVSSSYWKLSHKPENQLQLFAPRMAAE